MCPQAFVEHMCSTVTGCIQPVTVFGTAQQAHVCRRHHTASIMCNKYGIVSACADVGQTISWSGSGQASSLSLLCTVIGRQPEAAASIAGAMAPGCAGSLGPAASDMLAFSPLDSTGVARQPAAEPAAAASVQDWGGSLRRQERTFLLALCHRIVQGAGVDLHCGKASEIMEVWNCTSA